MTASDHPERPTATGQIGTDHAQQPAPVTELPGVSNHDTGQQTLPNPTMPGTVFLRGAGASRESWRALEQSLHRRGYMTVRDRTQAWHLARAGAAVVMVDFSSGPADRPAAVTVARVRARWRVSQPQKTIGDLLIKAERERLTAAGATWLSTRVITEVRDMELPIHQDAITLTTTTPDIIANAVAEHLQDGTGPVVGSPELTHPGGEPA